MTRAEIIMKLIAMEEEKDVLKERFEKAKAELRDAPELQVKEYRDIAMLLVPLTLEMLTLAQLLERMDRGEDINNNDLIMPE